MPGKTGLDVLKELKHPIPFYIVTGDLNVTQELSATPDLSGIIYKPIDMEQVAALIRDTLS
jgi:DNA-binding NtrC family response regulator